MLIFAAVFHLSESYGLKSVVSDKNIKIADDTHAAYSRISARQIKDMGIKQWAKMMETTIFGKAFIYALCFLTA